MYSEYETEISRNRHSLLGGKFHSFFFKISTHVSGDNFHSEYEMWVATPTHGQKCDSEYGR